MKKREIQLSPVGKLNHVMGYIGSTGVGKTQQMLTDTERALRAGFYCVAHDPNDDLPLVRYDGHKYRIIRVDGIDGLYKQLRTDAGHIIAVRDCDITDLVETCRTIVSSTFVETHGTKSEYKYGARILVVLDEIADWDEAKPNRLGDYAQNFLATRRHWNLALKYAATDPQLMHYKFINKATALRLYRVVNKKDFDRLKDAAIPDDTLEWIKSLPEGSRDSKLIVRATDEMVLK